MIDLSRDIHSLTDFKRRTTEFVKQLKETGAPVVLTVNGKAELVVQDAEAYQQLLQLAARLKVIEVAAIPSAAEPATLAEFEAAMDELAEGLDHVPVLAPEALTRESLYGHRA